MSIQQFSETIKSNIFKTWFDKLDKNIINTSAEKLRSKEQTAAKTSFYITKDTVKDMFKTITGSDMDSVELQLFMRELALPASGSSSAISGKTIKVNGADAVFFESIGFDTISTKLTSLLDSYPSVQEAYLKAESDYYDSSMKELQNSAEYKAMKLPDKKKAIKKIEDKAKERATFGYYFNKGHVIGIATNLTKQFRSEVEQADKLADAERKVLLEVLDRYIDKLQKDDLATANLPNNVDQELYASYIKSSGKYLVEIQHRVGNIQAGAASIPIVTELRNLFTLKEKDLEAIIRNSPALGTALLTTEGSPSYLNILARDLANIIQGKPTSKQVYKTTPRLVAKKTNKISRPAKKSKELADAKRLRDKVAKTKKDPKQFTTEIPDPQLQLFSLRDYINTHLQDVISANMGDGTSKRVLNYRTGRFAGSVEVQNLTQSREGLITAFYTYMKNPYATFSAGGAQEQPRSRDPQLLIANSIREIAAQRVANRLRSVAL